MSAPDAVTAVPDAAALAERLDAMLSAYGLSPATLSPMLTETGAIVAGNSMLHAFLGLPPSEYTGDIDLFISFDDDIPAFRSMLTTAGYEPVPRPTSAAPGPSNPPQEGSSSGTDSASQGEGQPSAELADGAHEAGGAAGADAAAGQGASSSPRTRLTWPYPYVLPGGDKIFKLEDFIHPVTGRKAQLIVTSAPSTAYTSFDLSCCATWFDGRELKSLFPSETAAREMFWLHGHPHPGSLSRKAKYERRGFSMVATPPGTAAAS